MNKQTFFLLSQIPHQICSMFDEESGTVLSIIPAISVCLSVCLSVCVSATAVSRQPLVQSNWNLPRISLGTRGCAFSRFDINRTSSSQVTAIYLSTNDRTQCYDVTIDVTILFFFFLHDWRHNSSSSFDMTSQLTLGTWVYAFSRFDINRTSGSQVTAIYLSTNDRTRCYDVTIYIYIFFLHVRPRTSILIMIREAFKKF